MCVYNYASGSFQPDVKTYCQLLMVNYELLIFVSVFGETQRIASLRMANIKVRAVCAGCCVRDSKGSRMAGA